MGAARTKRWTGVSGELGTSGEDVDHHEEDNMGGGGEDDSEDGEDDSEDDSEDEEGRTLVKVRAARRVFRARPRHIAAVSRAPDAYSVSRPRFRKLRFRSSCTPAQTSRQQSVWVPCVALEVWCPWPTRVIIAC